MFQENIWKLPSMQVSVQWLNIKGQQRDVQFKKVNAVSEKASEKYEETDNIIACPRKKLDLWKHSVNITDNAISE